MLATELIPLPGYQASAPVGIANIQGKTHVVGKSFEAPQPTWLPPSKATLWADGNVIYLSKIPGIDPTNLDATEAIRINEKGDVL